MDHGLIQRFESMALRSRDSDQFARRRVSFPLSFFVALLCFALPTFSAAQNNKETTVYPIVGTRISSSYGLRVHPIAKRRRHHAGLDLAAPSEAPVRAIRAGTVVFADPHGGYGNLIVIEHHNGMTSHYGHLHEISTEIGKSVSAGEIIGTVGTTGQVTGPHLHFEIRRDGAPVDPITIFPNIAKRGEG
jgi:murein DD-endopeptidase MepM/ murein hydrolase activator NlpD